MAELQAKQFGSFKQVPSFIVLTADPNPANAPTRDFTMFKYSEGSRHCRPERTLDTSRYINNNVLFNNKAAHLFRPSKLNHPSKYRRENLKTKVALIR